MDAARRLSSLLEELEAGHVPVLETLDRCCDLNKACTQLAADGEAVPAEALPALRSALFAAGSRLAQLGRRFSAPLDEAALASIQELQPAFGHFLDQMSAACQLLHAGVELCRRLGDEVARQGLRRGVGLLLRGGSWVLQSCTVAPAERAESAALLLEGQLRLMQDLWSLDPDHMAGLVQPKELLSWLEDAVEATQVVHAPLLNRGSPPPIHCLSALADVCSILLTHPAMSGHRQLLQQNPDLALSLVAVLEPGLPAAAVALALPAERRPAGFTWQLAAVLANVLAMSELGDALQKHLGAAGSTDGSGGAGSGSRGGRGSGSATASAAAQRLLLAGSRLLDLAVQRQAEEMDAETGSVIVGSCSLLLGLACGCIFDAVLEQHNQGRWRRSQEQLCLVRTVRKAVAQLPAVLRLVSAGMPGQPPPPGQERQQQARQQQDAPTRQRLFGSLPGLFSEAATVCKYLAYAPTLLYAMCYRSSGPSAQQAAPREPPPLLASLADVPDWCAAAVAALRVLPHCAALADAAQRPELRSSVAPVDMSSPDKLAATSLTVAVHTALACEACVRDTLFAPTATAEAVHAAHDALWQLHSAFCRLADWLAAGGGSSLPGLQRQRLELVHPLASTHRAPGMLTARQFTLAAQERAPGLDSHVQEVRCAVMGRAWHALAAATWVALQALAAGQEAQLLQQPQLCLKLASCLVDVAASGPVAVAGSPELLHLLQAALHGAPQGLGADEDVRQAALKAAASSPRLCAGMLSTGLLGSILEAEEAASASGPRGRRGTSQPFGEAQWLVEPLGCLLMEGSHVGMNADSGGGSQEHDASAGGGLAAEAGEDEDAQACRLQVQRAAAALDSACTHQLGRTQHGRLDLPAMLRRLLPPAETLAAALQEWWARPEQVAAARLEAAQAAAVRSCANLRCANLGLEGGAAAGEGVGCRRCSGCRISYYCGTACQNADWRAGHRKVCSELAAERQRQRAQQQQRQPEEQAA
ncbi:hypothetical protein ABPG75_002787 [Micractinium tetrahymenae]